MSKLKIFLIVVVGLIVLFRIMTCNWKEKKEIATIKPEKVIISGDLSEYLQIVDNQYEVTENYGGHLSIKVKAIKPYSAKELEGKDVSLSASLIGENGAPVSGTGSFHSEGNDKLRELLIRGSGEEVIIMSAILGSYWADEHAEKSKKFIVTSKLEDAEKVETTTQTDNSKSKNDLLDSGSENWDKLIDDYEKYLNEYVKFFKLAKEGDQAAVPQYVETLKKTMDLQVSLQKAQTDNNLSNEQILRFNKVMLKLTSTIKELEQ